MRSLLIVALLIVVLIAGKFLFFKKDAKPAGGPPATGMPKGGPGQSGPSAMDVDVIIATESTSTGAITSTGTVVANEVVDLHPESSGLLTQLNIKEGTFVNKGALIAKIKDDDIRANLRKNKYEEELAVQIEARQKKLLDINAISKEEYDISLNNINTLSADRDALLVALRKTEVRAPFSGKIGLKNISIGAYVTPATSIATMVQTNPIKVDFSIPEKYLQRVKVGDVVKLTADGSIEVFEAKIIAINPSVDVNLRTVGIRALLSNATGRLVPGMFVKVDVPLGEHKTIILPTEAIVPFVGGKKVYVKEDGKAKEVAVISSTRTDKNIEISEGIVPGDTIIVSGLMNLKAGQSVKVSKIQNLN
ncbi:MAG: efflux RND transporter periplasmic adaptor subunit [Saprospiraceae bacterium]|nr:efflux RND transporter periplasmic adaptor subunit [Saprospiraceae bacterium]